MLSKIGLYINKLSCLQKEIDKKLDDDFRELMYIDFDTFNEYDEKLCNSDNIKTEKLF